MKLNDLITVTRHRGYQYGKSYPYWIAQCGVVTTKADTKDEAMAHMVKIIQARLADDTDPVVLITPHNTWVAYQTNGGQWAYSRNGRTVCIHSGNRLGCVRAMQNHAAQEFMPAWHENADMDDLFRQAVAIVDDVVRPRFEAWWQEQVAYRNTRRAQEWGSTSSPAA